MDLQEIKNYFGDKMVLFNKNSDIDHLLNAKEKEILFKIGIPNYNLYGQHVMLKDIELINERYLKFGTREHDENDFFLFIDTKNHNIVFKFLGDEYNFLNTDLESYLMYIYLYKIFAKEIKIPQKLGPYYENHEKYALELAKQFLTINEDFKKGAWSNLIEEMGYGVI